MIESARAVADAVLYEGFLLFPYAKSALKNQMPFQFGVVMPEGYGDATEPSYQRSQFVVCDAKAVEGVLRFLQVRDDPQAREIPFRFSARDRQTRFPFDVDGLRGEIEITVEADEPARVTLEIRNRTAAPSGSSRNEALHAAFVSAHVLLEAHSGRFASLLDPPEQAKAAAARCKNERVFPVLLGDDQADAQTSAMLLVSPIILYDFPRVAQASRAHTFDGTEIDELLMLSVASLSDAEKREARAAHPFVRDLVEKAESMDGRTQQTLHGECVTVGGVDIRRGSRVRVHPKGRADVWDDLVRGMTARVTDIQTDLEGKRYIGVLFDADPASDMHEWYGRSFFYGADEVEPLP